MTWKSIIRCVTSNFSNLPFVEHSHTHTFYGHQFYNISSAFYTSFRAIIICIHRVVLLANPRLELCLCVFTPLTRAPFYCSRVRSRFVCARVEKMSDLQLSGAPLSAESRAELEWERLCSLFRRQWKKCLQRKQNAEIGFDQASMREPRQSAIMEFAMRLRIGCKTSNFLAD